MMTDRQLIEQFLELQEHQEQATDEQWQQALNVPEMHELLEQMAFTKRTLKNQELRAELPDAEAEWKAFASKYFGAERASHNHFFAFMRYRKIAVAFIGLILAVGVSFATIHIIKNTNNQNLQAVQKEQQVSSKPSTSLPVDTVKKDNIPTMESIVFDNVPLDKMLPEIAAYYHVEVLFQNEAARQYRFHFVWKCEDGLDHTIEKLNRFESLSVRRQDKKIVVE